MSLNTVAVRVGLEVGAKSVVRTAHRLGITSKLDANASIALGTSGVSLLELTGAYAPFANGGRGISPHVVNRIRAENGKVLYRRPPDPRDQVIEPRYVAMMNTMMRETLVSGTARKAEIPGWTAAGKTGTSQDFRDAWFIGYTANLVTGVWLGNDDTSPTRKATGGGLPVEIWTRFMRAAHQGVPVAALPGAQSNGLFPSFAPAQQASMIPAGASNSSTINGGTTSNGTAPVTTPQRAPAQPYPAQPAPVPVNPGSTSRPSHGAVRPEAASGLDGWLVERLFGGRR